MASSAAIDLVVQLKDQASKGFVSLGGAVDNVGKHVGILQTALGVFTGQALLGGVQALGRGLSSVFTESIANARESNAVMAQTAAAITSTGGAAGLTADQIGEMSSALSAAAGKSLFGDEDIQRGQNILLTFTNIGKNVFPQATQSVVDFAQAMHTDTTSAALLLGKALNDPVKGAAALRRAGVQLTDEQAALVKQFVATGQTAKAQNIILAEMTKEFGGSAAAAAAADGGFAQFRDQLGEMAEGIGKRLMPALSSLMGFLTGPEVQGGLQFLADALVSGVQTAVGWLTQTAIPALRSFVASVNDLWGDIVDGFNEAGIVGALQNGFGRLGDMVPMLKPITSWLETTLPAAVTLARDAVLSFVQAFQGQWVDSDKVLLIHRIFGEVGIAVGIARDAVITFVQALSGNWTNSDKILLIHQAFGELGLTIRNVVIPAIQSLIGWIQENWSWLSQVAVAVGITVAVFETLSAVVGVVSSVAATLTGAWATVAASVAGVTVAFEASSTVIGGIVAILGGPVTVAIGAVAVAVGLLYLAWVNDWLGIQEATASAWTVIQPILAGMPAYLQTVATGAAANWQSFVDVLTGAGTAISGAWTAISTSASANWSSLVSLVTAVAGAVSGAWQSIVTSAQANWDALVAVVSGAIAAVVSAVTSIGTSVADAVTTAWTGIVETATSAWNGVVAVVQGAVTTLQFIGGFIGGFFTSLFQQTWAVLGPIVAPYWDAVVAVVQTAWATLQSVVSTGVALVSALVTSGWATLTGIAATAWTAVASAVSSGWAAITSAVQLGIATVQVAASSGWQTISSATSTVWTTITAATSTAWNAISTTIATIVNTISSTLTTAWNTISSTVTTVQATISTSVSTTWTAIQTTISTAATGALTAAQTAFTSILAAAQSVFQSVLSAVQSAMSAIPGAVNAALGGIPGAIASAAASAAAAAVSLGAGIIAGIIQGLGNAAGAIGTALSNAVHAGIAAAKAAAGIKSPSTVFAAEVGRPIAEGIAAGIYDALPIVTRAGTDAVQAAMGAAQGALTDTRGSQNVAAEIARLLKTGDFRGGIFGLQEDDPFIAFLLKARTDATALQHVLDLLQTGDFRGGILGLQEDDPFILTLLQAAQAGQALNDTTALMDTHGKRLMDTHGKLAASIGFVRIAYERLAETLGTVAATMPLMDTRGTRLADTTSAAAASVNQLTNAYQRLMDTHGTLLADTRGSPLMDTTGTRLAETTNAAAASVNRLTSAYQELMSTRGTALMDTSGTRLADTTDAATVSVNRLTSAYQQLMDTRGKLLMDTRGATGLTSGDLSGGMGGDTPDLAANVPSLLGDAATNATAAFGTNWAAGIQAIQPQVVTDMTTMLGTINDQSFLPWEGMLTFQMRATGEDISSNLASGISGAAGEATGAMAGISQSMASSMESARAAVVSAVNAVKAALASIPRDITVHIHADVDPELQRHSPSIIEQTLMSIADMARSMPAVNLATRGQLAPAYTNVSPVQPLPRQAPATAYIAPAPSSGDVHYHTTTLTFNEANRDEVLAALRAAGLV